MRVTVSIPDALFHSAEVQARRLKVPRSHLYRMALADYLDRHITERLNEVYRAQDSRLPGDLRLAARRTLERD